MDKNRESRLIVWSWVMTYDNKFGVLVGLWSDIDIEVCNQLSEYGLIPLELCVCTIWCTINLIKPIFSIGITTLNYIYLTFCLVFYPWFTLVSGSHLFSIFTLSSTFCLVNDISSFHFRWILWWKDFFSCHVFRKQPLVANVFVCLSPRHPLFLLALAKNALHGDSGLTKGAHRICCLLSRRHLSSSYTSWCCSWVWYHRRLTWVLLWDEQMTGILVSAKQAHF